MANETGIPSVSGHPLVNFNFMLRVEGIWDLPCKSVHAFTRELDYELIQEGGLNDYVHMRRKPISHPFTLEVERYAGTDAVDPLPLGADLILPVMLLVSRRGGDFSDTARTYIFTGCTVTKKVYGELNAEHAGILTDTITIAYREMICIDTAFVGLDQNTSTSKKIASKAPDGSKNPKPKQYVSEAPDGTKNPEPKQYVSEAPDGTKNPKPKQYPEQKLGTPPVQYPEPMLGTPPEAKPEPEPMPAT